MVRRNMIGAMRYHEFVIGSIGRLFARETGDGLTPADWPAALVAMGDDAGRRGKALQGPDPFLKPPAELRRPVLEAPVEAEVVRPMLGDVGIELRLPADRDQVGLLVLQDGLSLLRLQDDADRHGRDVGFLADPLGERNLKSEAARYLRRRGRAGDATRGTVDHVDP